MAVHEDDSVDAPGAVRVDVAVDERSQRSEILVRHRSWRSSRSRPWLRTATGRRRLERASPARGYRRMNLAIACLTGRQ